MTKAQAESEATKLNATHPERQQWEWKALERAKGEWVIVRGPRRRIDPVTATTEAASKPPEPDAPWAGPIGDLPGYR